MLPGLWPGKHLPVLRPQQVPGFTDTPANRNHSAEGSEVLLLPSLLTIRAFTCGTRSIFLNSIHEQHSVVCRFPKEVWFSILQWTFSILNELIIKLNQYQDFCPISFWKRNNLSLQFCYISNSLPCLFLRSCLQPLCLPVHFFAKWEAKMHKNKGSPHTCWK